MTRVQSAQYPDIANLKAQLESNNVKYGDVMSRICAVAKDTEAPGSPTCTGNLTIGIFFDGTGNNEKADHGGLGSPLPLRQRLHSNVVRLYHAFPDESRQRQRDNTNKSYRFYIPGVGTKFPEIGDSGGMLGSATAWGGEPRIIWGLIQALNAVHMYYHPDGLLSDQQAGRLANNIANDFPVSLRQFLEDPSWPITWASNMKQHHQHRRNKFKALVNRLKNAIPPNATPRVRQINLSVFGFSRGAAESRAFVNWLLEICEGTTGKRTLAGIPLEIQFLGIFDTVASVGMAAAYSIVEGRQGWAEDNMQIPTAQVPIRQCVHMVAAHETRACFPLDSARIDGTYPPNTTEIVYPGAHSDVGGGYKPQALGKDDWNSQEGSHSDHQLARASCFDMYCRAMAAGVPFYTLGQLFQQNLGEVAKALLPAADTLNAIAKYIQQSGIPVGPVEDMARAHMATYHAWRWKLGLEGHANSAEYRRIQALPNRGKDYDGESTWILETQIALLQVIAAYCAEIDRRMSAAEGGRVPLNNTLRPLENKLDIAKSVGAGWATAVATSILPGSALGGIAAGSAKFYQLRRRWLTDAELVQQAHNVSRQAKAKLEAWRQWLSQNFHPEWHDLDAEREGIWLLESVLKADQLPNTIGAFFEQHVHDSMAGFIGFGMPEFEVNGYGLGKFRRIYFGNHGDKVLRERVASENTLRGNKTGEAIWRNNKMTLPPVATGSILPQPGYFK